MAYPELKRLALLQYLLMLKSNDFGEAGFLRVRMDFARYLLKIPLRYQLSSPDLGRFDKIIRDEAEPYKDCPVAAIKQEIKKVLTKTRGEKNVVIASRKEDFPLIICGPQTLDDKDGCKIIIIEQEDVRSPSAVLAIAAFSQNNGEIVVRKEAVENICFRKWEGNTSFTLKRAVLSLYRQAFQENYRSIFIDEMTEQIIIHELAHVAIAESLKDHEAFILGKMLDAHLSTHILDILNELLAEWHPERGALPFLAKMAATNPEKAKRMFFRYLADANFKPNGDQAFMHDYSRLLFNSLKPYLKEGLGVDFSLLLMEAPSIYQYFLDLFYRLVGMSKEIMEKASFVMNGGKTNFSTLAAVQHQKFQDQLPGIDPCSDFYRRYFWSNIVAYLKLCAPASFSEISDRLLAELKTA